MRKILYTLLLCLCCCPVRAQLGQTVQNRPYIDLRPVHFGVFVGTHVQDIEFVNAGPQVITTDDGTTINSLVTVDQDRWDNGLNVGVVGELRLSSLFQLRLAPGLYFGNRHFTFHNFTPSVSEDSERKETEERQDLKSVYVSSAVNLIFAAPRAGNHRPYLMAGVNPMINLSGRDNDYLKLKRYDAFLEVGAGCDFYLPFFKLRPELKFLYGLTNSIDSKHAANIRSKDMLRYTNAVSEARSKMIVLTFYFE